MDARVLIGVASAAALLSGAAVWLLKPSSPSGGEKPAVLAESQSASVTGGGTQALAQIQRRLAILEAKQALQHAANPVVVEQDQRSPVDTRTQFEARQREEEETEAELVQRLRSEPNSQERAEELGNQIDALIDIPSLAGTKVTEVTCGSTTCRVNVDYATPQEQETFVETMMHGLGRYHGFNRSSNEDGQLQSRLYLTKAPPVRYLDKDGNEIDRER